jgi:hypothetical protein
MGKYGIAGIIGAAIDAGGQRANEILALREAENIARQAALDRIPKAFIPPQKPIEYGPGGIIGAILDRGRVMGEQQRAGVDVNAVGIAAPEKRLAGSVNPTPNPATPVPVVTSARALPGALGDIYPELPPSPPLISGKERGVRDWEEKPLHERYASPREALNNMPDAEYKIFADANKHIPGLGYVIDKESGKLQRIIPASRRQPELPEMNAEQLHAMTGILSAMHQGRMAATSEARLGIEGRRADITEKRYEDMTNLERDKLDFENKKLDAGSGLKDPMNFIKALEMFSPDEIIDGEKTGRKNYRAGAEVLDAAGYPIPKGMKIPSVKPKMTEAEARAALTAKKITGKAEDNYIANYKKSGVVQ